MVAGLILGLWLRWWAVPIISVGWVIVFAVRDPSIWLSAGLLSAVNGAVGVVLALVLRHVVDVALRPRRNQPGHRR
jgi:hypothetical protein